MKNIFFVLIAGLFTGACGQQSAVAEHTVSDSSTTTAPAALLQYAYPVSMANWKLGDPLNTKAVLDMYSAWDKGDGKAVASFFADSAELDLPGAVRITLSKGQIESRFVKLRKMFGASTNHIVSAYALYNEEFEEDWVMVVSYNKWTYKDGVRDSMLYADNWRLKDGKVNYLTSLEEKPASALLKTLERGR
ncbi:nuclear transport factor 2 family protein [Foetidibacter luteolus]|uniref:nuclear transport factor 2 family protein n=1 Tax=Foetidibacter luteolus TaxID=2608880 RepID=UPI00129AA9D3|nr:nuclear transport factor 2 family protein [Foetidibacter luteolus]